jgi:hypothetical protein
MLERWRLHGAERMREMRTVIIALVLLLALSIQSHGIEYSANVILPDQYQDDSANKDIPIIGTMKGNYTYTHFSDNKYEAIREVSQDKTSYLEHKWTINVTSGNKTNVTFYVEAYHTRNSENDHFVFAYSIDNVNYYDMVTVTKTSDDHAYQTFEMPKTISGTVYIRVRDTDRSSGKTNKDTIYIDRMFIRSFAGGVYGQSGSMTTSLTPSSSTGIVQSFLNYVYRLFEGE